MGEFFLGSDEVRYLIQYAGRIKRDGKCVECDGTGYTNWDEDGGDIKYGKTDKKDRISGECEECNGVGYIW